jgi:hypothetical protein
MIKAMGSIGGRKVLVAALLPGIGPQTKVRRERHD